MTTTTRSLRIVHIGTADNSGGAARAAFRLHKALQSAGCESRMVVGWKVEVGADVEAVMQGDWARKLFRRFFMIVDTGLSLQYSLLPWSRDFLDNPSIRAADVIHLHNLHGGYFPYRILPKLGRIAPLVWSLHDMWAMTGHCAYSYECERWKTGCGRCPILGEYPAVHMDTTSLHWRIKDRTYRSARISVVAAARWMADVARQSPLLKRFEIHTIPYGTNLSVFRPVNKAHAREMLRLPEDARVILLFATSDRRKGGALMVQALARLAREPRPWLLVAGDPLKDAPPGFQARQVGYVNSDDLLNLCYGAADLFVLPTLAENLPLSILDAMAAGTPVVAFDAGGVPDLVRHLETGYLVTQKDPEGLARAIAFMLESAEERRRMGTNARQAAERDYSTDTYARRYQSLYEEIIGMRRTSSHARA